MIAYKIKVNRKTLAVASQEDWSILTAHVTASRNNGPRGVEDYIRFSMGGLSEENPQGYAEHFRWPDVDLKVGDKVEIEIVSVEKIDAPIKRYRSDAQVQENPFTDEEWKELRYKDYLDLKKEFEED